MKKQVNQLLKLKSELDIRKNKKYKIEAIIDSIIYVNKIKSQ